MKNKLKENFYLQEDVVSVSKQLLGKVLHTHINGIHTAGIIVETEAYKAPEDAGSHAYQNKKTNRTGPFFEKGGIAQVYLIYGIYYLLNVITNQKDIPEAVLIRAIEPIIGIDEMLKRRNMEKIKRNLTAGPGILTIALGIDIGHNRTSFLGDTIWIEDAPIIKEEDIIASPRVGLNIPEPWYSIPWRFRIKDNKWTSPAK